MFYEIFETNVIFDQGEEQSVAPTPQEAPPQSGQTQGAVDQPAEMPYDQGQDVAPQGGGFGQQEQPGGFPGDQQDVPPEDPEIQLEPLKKFVTIQKFQMLQEKLRAKDITMEELDIVLKFAKDLSFETLERIFSKLVKEIEQIINEKAKVKAKERRN